MLYKVSFEKISFSFFLAAPAITKAIPLYASAKNALVTSSAISAVEETIILGMWRIINQIKIIVPKRAAINWRLIFKRIAMPEPINAVPAK